MKSKIFALIICLALLFPAAFADARNIIKIGQDATIATHEKANNVITVFGQATINGLVENNVVTVGGSVVLSRDAVVRGNVVCVGGVVAKGGSAQIYGDITEINSANFFSMFNSAFNSEWEGWSWIFAVISVCFFFVLLIFALFVIILLPRPIIAITTVIRDRKVKSFVWGVLGMMLIGPLAVLLAISIVGIPLIPLEITLVVLAIVFGFIAVSALTGTFVLIRILRRKEAGMVKATLLGLTLLWLIGWIPYLGWIIKAIAATTGFGGVMLALFDRRPQPLAPVPSGNFPEDKVVNS